MGNMSPADRAMYLAGYTKESEMSDRTTFKTMDGSSSFYIYNDGHCYGEYSFLKGPGRGRITNTEIDAAILKVYELRNRYQIKEDKV